MTSAVNTGQILEALNDKLDRDTLNINDTGEINMASMGMPSGVYDSLTLGASGTQYTAPANGYIMVAKLAGISSTGYIRIINVTTGLYVETETYGASGAVPSVILSVRKNDIFSVTYGVTGNTVDFRFYYAVGSESEAS